MDPKNLIHKSPWMTISEIVRPGPALNKASKVVEIDIEGVIGGSFWEEENKDSLNTKEKMRKELKALAELKATKIIVNINSPGGDIGHGLSIHDLLAQHNAEVVTRVYGLTGSIATVIAQAGETREISDNALYLVHRASYVVIAYVNQNLAEDLLEDLKVFDNKILDIYQKRSGMDRGKIEDLMNAQEGVGKWIDADETKDFGFVDSIFEPMKAVAMASEEDLSKYKLPIPKNYFDMDPKNKDNAPDISNRTLMGQIKDLFAKFIPSDKDKKEDTVPEIPEDLVNQINGFEERLNTLEQTNTDLTGQIETLQNDLTSKETELTKAQTTISELQTKLTQAKAGSTKVPGTTGAEDREDKNLTPEQIALENDAAKIRAELSDVHPDSAN